MSDIAPGWYKDPADLATQRYWDGEGWIGDAIPADAEPPETPPEPRPMTEPPVPPVPLGATAAPVSPSQERHHPTFVPYNPHRPAAFPEGIDFAVLAPLSARFMARIIDILVVLGLNIIVNGWFVHQYLEAVMPIVSEFQRQALSGEAVSGIEVPSRVSWLEVAILSIATALWFAYEVPSIGNTGQTLGKKLMHIKVVAIESQKVIGFRRAWRRWNPLGLPTLFWGCYGLGLLLQGVNLLSGVADRPLHQAIHDKSAGTVVIHVGTAKRNVQEREKEEPE